ncbi:aminoglycoside phosphotransferase family protein [Actinoplanes sp. NPDC051494]|uniref:aminoglycoside phosphotransferase family protein n=1 Tax=Actinoplanes sp. NPDC051494 TaxID=3363907 RepID=UPI0037B710ED
MLPDVFVANVVGNWGEAGRRWLDTLPRTVAAVAGDWELTVGEPFPLTFNWVAPVRRADGSAAVLKVGVPGSPHLATEAAALTGFAGEGAVRLLARDRVRGALLLERAEPGTTLRALVRDHDEQATAVLVDIIRRLHRPVVPGVEDIAGRSADFAAHLERYPGDDPLPRELVVRAAGLFAELCQDGGRVLLHGDLHHENVLAGTREPWLAIDPHGVAGPPGAELAPILCNPLTGDEPTLALLPRRVEQLADGLGLSLDLARAWGFVLAVLSEVWDADSGPSTPGRALRVALALRS